MFKIPELPNDLKFILVSHYNQFFFLMLTLVLLFFWSNTGAQRWFKQLFMFSDSSANTRHPAILEFEQLTTDEDVLLWEVKYGIYSVQDLAKFYPQEYAYRYSFLFFELDTFLKFIAFLVSNVLIIYYYCRGDWNDDEKSPTLFEYFVIYMCYLTLSVFVFYSLDMCVFTDSQTFWRFFSCLITFTILCIVVLYIVELIRTKAVKFFFEQAIILFFFFLFSIYLLLSSNYIFTFVSLVGLNICVYTLIGQNKTPGSLEASAKYWAFGIIPMAFFLFGSFLLFCEFGTCEYGEIGVSLANGSLSAVALLGFGFILLTFFFKLGAFPLSVWVADVYEGSSMFALCLLVLTKFSTLYALCVILQTLPSNYLAISKFIFIIGALGSVFIGAFGAMFTQKFKRFLAFSGMTHVGTALACFVGTDWSFGFPLFYILVYCLTSVAFILLNARAFRASGVSGTIFLTDMAYNRGQSVFFFLPTIVLLFSFAGLPPTLGFFAKLGVFLFLATSATAYSIGVLIALLFSMLLTNFNYLRVAKVTFFELWYNVITISKMDPKAKEVLGPESLKTKADASFIPTSTVSSEMRFSFYCFVLFILLPLVIAGRYFL